MVNIEQWNLPTYQARPPSLYLAAFFTEIGCFYEAKKPFRLLTLHNSNTIDYLLKNHIYFVLYMSILHLSLDKFIDLIKSMKCHCHHITIINTMFVYVCFKTCSHKFFQQGQIIHTMCCTLFWIMCKQSIKMFLSAIFQRAGLLPKTTKLSNLNRFERLFHSILLQIDSPRKKSNTLGKLTIIWCPKGCDYVVRYAQFCTFTTTHAKDTLSCNEGTHIHIIDVHVPVISNNDSLQFSVKMLLQYVQKCTQTISSLFSDVVGGEFSIEWKKKHCCCQSLWLEAKSESKATLFPFAFIVCHFWVE